MEKYEQQEDSKSSRDLHIFKRRFMNPAMMGHTIAGLLFLGLSWYFFKAFPSLWGAGLAFALICLAVWNFLATVKQPLGIRLEFDAALIRYPFTVSRLPYNRIERLHWSRTPSGFGSRGKDTLKIETKDGHWHKLDYMQGKLKKIRGILERRVYGETL